MKTVKSKIVYKEKAPRWELLVRIIYAIPVSIVLWIFSFIASIAAILLWFHILILGRRHKSLHNLVRMYIAYIFKTSAYFQLLTDERPPIIPSSSDSEEV
jgi:hypothetical protein